MKKLTWEFFSKRRNISLNTFLSDTTSLEEAYKKFDSCGVEYPKDNDMLLLVCNNIHKKVENVKHDLTTHSDKSVTNTVTINDNFSVYSESSNLPIIFQDDFVLKEVDLQKQQKTHNTKSKKIK